MMTLKERLTNVGSMRTWTDQIPFHYEYTAGVAGERFLRGLREGKILGSECPKCKKTYIPPKTYCLGCFVEVKKLREAGPEGTVAAVAESSVGFEGERLKRHKTFVFVGFTGVTGGLIHFGSGKGLKIGDRVAPRFKPVGSRKGSLLDIEGFFKT